MGNIGTQGRRALLSALIAAVLIGPPSSMAQVLYGSMVGHVKDASEASVPDASVVIRNMETNQTRATKTNDVGDYSFPTIASGPYELTVSKPGFSSVTRTGLEVATNNITRLDLTMQVGSVAESLTVSASGAVLQTDRSEVRSEVSGRKLEDLPVAPGRNYQQLFRTLPGFTPPSNIHSIPSNPTRALQFYVNGASRSSNNTRIDGASSTNIQLPWIVAYVPALEAIEAVNVVTNSFDAEQGLAGGAAISVQTRSGSNDRHGSAFAYHTDQHIKAKPFFLPTGQNQPKLIYNQFGATTGGPIRKNKLFYFLSYEGTLDRETAARFTTVPTAAIKRGDMSGSATPIYDPDTGDALGANRAIFTGNQVPLSRISSISQKIVNLIPDPTLPDLTNNYYATAPFQFDRHNADTRVDWNPSPKLSAFGRFGMLHYETFNPQVFGDKLGGPPTSGLGGNPGNGEGSRRTSHWGLPIFFHQPLLWMPISDTRGRIPTRSSPGLMNRSA